MIQFLIYEGGVVIAREDAYDASPSGIQSQVVRLSREWCSCGVVLAVVLDGRELERFPIA